MLTDHPLIIYPRKVLYVLISLTALLVIGHLSMLVLRFGFGYDYVHGLARLFDLDREHNIPTFFSSSLLLVASALFAVTGASQRSRGDLSIIYWQILALLFLYLAADEASSIHELLIAPMRKHLGARGFFYFGWVIPALIVLPLLVAFFWRFVLSLPKRTRRLFLLSAVIYVGGALSVELIGGYQYERYGGQDLTYALITTLEETLEMAGLVILIYAQLDYMASYVGEIRVRFGNGNPPITDQQLNT